MTPAGPIVAAAVQRRRGDPSYLMQILCEVQEALDWIAPETAEAIASQLRIPHTQVQSALQFYSFLYDKPRGAYRAAVFRQHHRPDAGQRRPLASICSNRLGVKRGEVSPDGLVSVDLTSCTGMCDQGPAMLVNNRAVTRLTARRIDEIGDLDARARRSRTSGRPSFSASRTTSGAPTRCSAGRSSRARRCARRSRAAARACSTR